MRNLKIVLGICLLAAALIFSVQNAQPVQVLLLAWNFPTSLALIIFIAIVTGFIGGWVITSARRHI